VCHVVKCESTFKEHVKSSSLMRSTVITDQGSYALHKVEKLLIIYLLKF
jgi:hypothetical protein